MSIVQFYWFGALFDPFLIFLPQTSEGSYDYDVDAVPKFSRFEPVPEMAVYTLVKLWKDEGAGQARPNSVTVDILKNGQLHESVVLGPENNWSYTWKAPAGDQWSVVERQVPEGYTVTISGNDTSFVITNTRKPEIPDIPQTGDTAPLLLYILLTCLSGFGLVILGIAVMRGKNNGKKR